MIYLYEPSIENDLMLAGWWAQLKADDELGDMFVQSVHPLGKFMAAMHRVELGCLVDNEGIYGAFWLEPFMDGAFASVWIDKRRRADMGVITEMRKLFTSLISDKCVALLFITCQEELLDLYETLGYTMLGCIPKLWDGKDTWFLAMAQEVPGGKFRWPGKGGRS